MITIERHLVDIQQRMKYPFHSMSIGESFLICDHKKADSARIAAYSFTKRKQLDWQFAVRKDKDGWRIIRIK